MPQPINRTRRKVLRCGTSRRRKRPVHHRSLCQAPAANVIGTAVATGNAGSDPVGVAKASANDDQYIGVFDGAPTACVAGVAPEGAGG